MSAKGTFEINLTPQQDEGFEAGRMLIDKTYQGDLSGTGRGQMISSRLENGTAVYFAIEAFVGELNGKNGGFTMLHKGHMSKDAQSLEVNILDGSGTGDLTGISGSLLIIQDAGGHGYELSYEI